MPAINKMSALCNKIERRLGTKPLPLPEDICKDKWPEVIEEDTIETFSRFFPRRFKVIVDQSCYKNGWYYIDKLVPDNVEILGVADIDWEAFSDDTVGAAQYAGLLGAEDIMMLQAAATSASAYNNGIYIEREPPNKIRFKNSSGGIINIPSFPIDLLLKHSPNLMTISPTMMETFEKLAIADVANFIYEFLKYYDGVDTVFANVDIKLDSFAEKGRVRDDIIQELKDAYVSFSNEGQNVIICQ